MTLIDSGSVEPSELLADMESQITKAKEEAFNRKDILDKVERLMSACKEESWLEDYNKDYNRYNSSRGAHLNLKRAEKARILVNKIPDVADVLIDAALVLGGEATLKILYMKLVGVLLSLHLQGDTAVGSSANNEHINWPPVEAVLYCIRAVSDFVPVTEAKVMPQIMSLLPKVPHQPQLLTTVCLSVGAYARWLDMAPNGLSFLPSLIDILVSGMNTSEDSAAAAALSFRHIYNVKAEVSCDCEARKVEFQMRHVRGSGQLILHNGRGCVCSSFGYAYMIVKIFAGRQLAYYFLKFALNMDYMQLILL